MITAHEACRSTSVAQVMVALHAQIKEAAEGGRRSIQFASYTNEVKPITEKLAEKGYMTFIVGNTEGKTEIRVTW